MTPPSVGLTCSGTMAQKLIFIGGAVGVAVAALALVVVILFGLLVWLGGSSWARRPDA